MPNDAKLGLIVGVALIILVAVVFFRKEASADSVADPPSATMVKPVTPPQGPATENRPSPAAPSLTETRTRPAVKSLALPTRRKDAAVFLGSPEMIPADR